MQWSFKNLSVPIISSIVTAIFLFPLRTIYALNIEKWAADNGLDSAAGWALSMLSAEWGVLYTALFFISLGMTLTLWAQSFYGRWKRSKIQPSAGIDFHMRKSGSNISIEISSPTNIANWWHTVRLNEVVLFVEFSNPLDKPVIWVTSDSKDLEWFETYSTDNFAFINVKGELLDKRVHCHYTSVDHTSEKRRQSPHVVQKVQHLSAEDFTVLDEIMAKQDAR